MKVVKSLLNKREVGIAVPLILILILVAIVNPVFYNTGNLVNVLRQTSFTFIIAVPMTIVLVAAGLDLSVGSVLALAGVTTGLALLAGVPIWLAILIGIGTGMVVGGISGLLIARFSIPSLIVTLGMMYIARGLVQVLTRGKPIYPLPDDFNFIGQGFVGEIPIVVIVAAAVGVAGHILLGRTVFGRSVYAVGGNRETARVSGINVNRILIWVYVMTGAGAALSGVLTTARLGSALANTGLGMELQVIAAVIIGGTSMFGGSGTIIGTFIGVLFMNVLANGMVLMKVSVFWQLVVIGAIIIVAVGVDQYNRKRRGMVH
ncbi:MAG: ABC transporter permease [Hyphomicrobiales bacterium]|nr:ABC transporter permease [Hyphomicrobiales bacterium]